MSLPAPLLQLSYPLTVIPDNPRLLTAYNPMQRLLLNWRRRKNLMRNTDFKYWYLLYIDNTLFLFVINIFLCLGRGICLDPANINYQTSIATLSYCLPILTLVILIIGMVYCLLLYKHSNYILTFACLVKLFLFLTLKAEFIFTLIKIHNLSYIIFGHLNKRIWTSK